MEAQAKYFDPVSKRLVMVQTITVAKLKCNTMPQLLYALADLTLAQSLSLLSPVFAAFDRPICQ
jgi:hypothetical protein